MQELQKIDELQKAEIIKKALVEGIIKDPQWLDQMNHPMPVWAVLEIALQLLEKLNPSYGSYD
jgi:hypothetical protein